MTRRRTFCRGRLMAATVPIVVPASSGAIPGTGRGGGGAGGGRDPGCPGPGQRGGRRVLRGPVRVRAAGRRGGRAGDRAGRVAASRSTRWRRRSKRWPSTASWRAGSSGIPLLTDFREPSEQLQADVLVGVATDSSADAMDEYDRLRSELEANRRGRVADNQAELEQQQAERPRAAGRGRGTGRAR